MKKKVYQAPRIETMHMVERCSVLASSGDVVPPTITISETEEISSGFVNAKQGSVWDDEE